MRKRLSYSPVILFVVHDVPVAVDWHRLGDLDTVLDVVPVRQPRVPLLPRPAVKGDHVTAPLTDQRDQVVSNPLVRIDAYVSRKISEGIFFLYLIA